ncbi:MAG: CDP-glucose 4,6-dehydratase [Elusimicrobia bacterium]|nr:CDP-glucose 4,6-dehydratase [Elusimicrobiota bacterium]
MNNCFNGIYKGKRVLVTGHTGFKGSWLTMWLLSLGAKVTGYSLYLPSVPCNFSVCKLDKHIEHITGDVRDLKKLETVFKKCKPEIVFHLAAQPIVKKSFEDPKLTFDTNAGGTVNIFECLRKNPFVKSAVIITSDKCYKNQEWKKGYTETDILGGDDPYSASKACAEIVANSYIKSFFNNKNSTRISTTRAGNVIGGGDWAADRIVPDCIRAFSNNRVVVIRNPKSTRPWQHVLEPLSGYLWLGAQLYSSAKLHGESFNFGPAKNVDQSVKEVVEALAKHWGNGRWRIDNKKRFGKETHLLKLSCEKSFKLIGWKPTLSFKETIEKTAHWYKRYYLQNGDMYSYSMAQIAEYASLALKRGSHWSRKIK